jgi:hypothetical protein
VTFDDDVAAALEQLRRARGTRFKTLVNEVLREGLKTMRAPRPNARPFTTGTVDLGRPRLANLDNVTEVLAIAEGDAFR